MAKNQNQPLNRICIGKITGAHGIKGLVKILLFDFDPELLKNTVYTAENGDQILSISLKNKNGKYYLASVDGVTDRNGSETLKGTALFIDSDFIPHDETQDILGFTALDEDGQRLGEVIAVENFGASDLLEIRPDMAESYYIPFTDDVVVTIDDAAKCLIIKPLEMI